MTAGVSALTCAVISAGAVLCVVGGQLAPRWGSAKVACTLLAMSGLCCLTMPWMLTQAPWWLFALWLLLWGATISSDSPQFSALNAANAPADQVGSVLLAANSVGFSISVLSILLSSSLWPWIGLEWIGWFWLPGPLLGLWAMRGLLSDSSVPPSSRKE